MSAILPPSEQVWWKTPVGKEEIVWIALALTWCLIMFAMMPIWHVYGKQNLSNEAYKTTPVQYEAKVKAMVEQHTIRTQSVGEMDVPVVAPPAGSDVYILGRLWSWYPMLEFKKGESYRLHLSSLDWQHGFSLQPININLQIVPEYETVITITPDTSGEFTIVCNEYCGILHHTMLGKIYVTE
ncbi:MAG TPA: cytochrome C oxidase subunit II [Thioploca sp.]|nr:cytochrome C oxidase subunit II [Thioploca sp.]